MDPTRGRAIGSKAAGNRQLQDLFGALDALRAGGPVMVKIGLRV